jgi:RimJ/RimL family protein N-acetyltransferase
VRIRAAEPRDADALVRLGVDVGAEPGGWLITSGSWRSAAEERRYLKAIRRYPHAAVYVAEDDLGSVVGRLSLARDQHPSSAHVADLGLMVARTHRRQGIGRALMEQAVRWARSAGVRKLELHVFPHNDAAIALYESMGFEREGYRKGHYQRDDGYQDAILMALELGSE